MLVYAGLLDQFNLLREFVIEGVRDFVLRAKILPQAVDRNEAAVAALPPDAREEQRQGYLEARYGTRAEWTTRWRRPSFYAAAMATWTGNCAH